MRVLVLCGLNRGVMTMCRGFGVLTVLSGIGTLITAIFVTNGVTLLLFLLTGVFCVLGFRYQVLKQGKDV